MSHFLQSEAWASFQESLGKTVVRDQGDGWSYIAVLEKGKINSRLYSPYGPEVKDNSSLAVALESLQAKARSLGATFVRVEPTGIEQSDHFAKLGLHKVSRSVQPYATSVIDLTQSEEAIISAMSANSRNLYRTYKDKGLSVHYSHNPANIDVLIRLLHGVAARTGMIPQSDSYLQLQARTLLPNSQATLYNVTYDNTPIVAALVYDSDTTRYYAHAAADYPHRKLNAGTALVAQMILDAKAKGLTSFDLYGIWPQAVDGSTQAGINRFKRSFGGHDVHYHGTWELPVKPLAYSLYRNLVRLDPRRLGK